MPAGPNPQLARSISVILDCFKFRTLNTSEYFKPSIDPVHRTACDAFQPIFSRTSGRKDMKNQKPRFSMSGFLVYAIYRVQVAAKNWVIFAACIRIGNSQHPMRFVIFVWLCDRQGLWFRRTTLPFLNSPPPCQQSAFRPEEQGQSGKGVYSLLSTRTYIRCRFAFPVMFCAKVD